MLHMIYLDNAATTIRKPETVYDAVRAAMESAGNCGRGVHGASLGASRIIYDARCKVAKLIGAEDPSRIAFSMNATASLNMALFGMLEKGDHVITSDHAHNSVLRPLYMLEAERGVELTILPCDGKGNVDPQQYAAAIKENTKAIVATHGSNLTGNLQDLYAIGAIAKANGLWFVVDAAQTVGVFPIDVQAMNIDVLCFTGHKSLLGPQGTGGLYLKTGRSLRPLFMGGSGIETYRKSHPDAMPVALEAGTQNVHGLAGLGAALDYILEQGVDSLREKELDLMWTFYNAVSKMEGVTVYGDFSHRERCPIVSLNIRDYDSAKIADILDTDYGIATRPGGHCAPRMHEALGTVEQGAVRFSFSHFNTMEEVQVAIRAVKELAE